MGSAGLAAVAATIALLPTAGPLPVNFAYSGDLKEIQLVTGLVVLSALLFIGASADLWRRPVPAVVLTSVAVLCVGVVLFVLTFTVWAYTVTDLGGSTTVVQLYPQPLLPAIWGFVGLVFSPLASWMGKQMIDPPEPRPVSPKGR